MQVPLDPRSATDPGLRADVGVFGGSGFYEFLEDAVDLDVDTPFGAPASPIRIGTLAGRRVAFLARHGRRHQFAAHRVPFRANVWALASVGVGSIVGPCSVGALQERYAVGDVVVVDQLVDRTRGRADTFHDVGADVGLPGSDGPVYHLPFADPYDSEVRAALVGAGRSIPGLRVHDGGTMVVINGPRFSTRAESRWFADMGWDVVNMTGYPEAALVAEAGVPYASVALVTDHDAGVEGADDERAPVTLEAVMAVVADNVASVKRLLEAAAPSLP